MASSQPRLATTLADEIFGAQTGAAADASRAYPVAVLASPAEEPLTIDVETGMSGTRVQVAQWLTELAVAMNRAIKRFTLFDDRAVPVTRLLFHSEVSSGDIRYDWTPAAAPLPEVPARLAWMKVLKLTARSTSEGVEANLVVQVTMSGFAQGYACQVTSPGHWERAVFACIGQKILGDKRFWDGAASVP
jgi:hypothetical protein